MTTRSSNAIPVNVPVSSDHCSLSYYAASYLAPISGVKIRAVVHLNGTCRKEAYNQSATEKVLKVVSYIASIGIFPLIARIVLLCSKEYQWEDETPESGLPATNASSPTLFHAGETRNTVQNIQESTPKRLNQLMNGGASSSSESFSGLSASSVHNMNGSERHMARSATQQREEVHQLLGKAVQRTEELNGLTKKTQALAKDAEEFRDLAQKVGRTRSRFLGVF